MNPLDIVNNRINLFKLVTPQQVIVNTGLQANITGDSINIPIVTAMNLKIKPILGNTLFGKLKQEYIAANYDANLLPDSNTSVDGIDYKELYEKVFLPLCWWSFIEALIYMSVKLDEKGLTYHQADYVSNGEITAYNQVNNRQKKIAENYTEELVCYVKETFKNDTVIAKELGLEGTYSSGIYFWKPNKKCRYC